MHLGGGILADEVVLHDLSAGRKTSQNNVWRIFRRDEAVAEVNLFNPDGVVVFHVHRDIVRIN